MGTPEELPNVLGDLPGDIGAAREPVMDAVVLLPPQVTPNWGEDTVKGTEQASVNTEKPDFAGHACGVCIEHEEPKKLRGTPAHGWVAAASHCEWTPRA
jgi:hypothetical protein